MLWGDSLTGSAWPMCVKPTFEVPKTACKTCSRHIYTYMHSCMHGQFLFSYYRLHWKVGFPSSGNMVATFWYTSHSEESESPVGECLHSAYHIREKADTTSWWLLPFLHTQASMGHTLPDHSSLYKTLCSLCKNLRTPSTNWARGAGDRCAASFLLLRCVKSLSTHSFLMPGTGPARSACGLTLMWKTDC